MSSESARKRVLVWDAPNIDMTLTQLLGRRPGPSDRPDMRALLRWLSERRQAEETIEASVFINVPPDKVSGLRGWVSFLTGVGFRVFAKPKAEGTDIDDEMVDYIRALAPEAVEIVVGSNDAHCFLEPLKEVAGKGVVVTVLGFAEVAADLAASDEIGFVDLEDVPGLLNTTLNRVRLEALPEAGGWFEPRAVPGSSGEAQPPVPPPAGP